MSEPLTDDVVQQRIWERNCPGLLKRHEEALAELAALRSRVEQAERDHQAYIDNIASEYRLRIKAEADLAACREALDTMAQLASDAISWAPLQADGYPIKERLEERHAAALAATPEEGSA